MIQFPIDQSILIRSILNSSLYSLLDKRTGSLGEANSPQFTFPFLRRNEKGAFQYCSFLVEIENERLFQFNLIGSSISAEKSRIVSWKTPNRQSHRIFN